MGKLTLKIDSVVVESFETGDEHRGQVLQGTFYHTCGGPPNCDTVDPVC
jgi:hypothetical protein